MNIALWIVASVLAAAFLASGVVKLVWSRERLVAKGNGWAESWSPAAIRAIGVAEVLAAAGLVVPRPALLTPLAATGLVLLMAGAAVVHRRRAEHRAVAATVAYLTLAAFVAFARF